MFNVKALKEDRQPLIEALRAVDQDRQTRGEDAVYTAEELSKFDALSNDIKELDEKIETAKRQELIPEDTEPEHRYDDLDRTRGYNGLMRSKVESAIAGYLTRGTSRQTPQMRANMERSGLNPYSDELTFRLFDEAPSSTRALEVKTDAKGGYTVERYPINRIEKALLEYSGGLRQYATIVRTPKGGDYPIPTIVDNDTAEDHVEHATVSTSEVVFGEKVIGCGTIDSKLIKISLELLQDSALNMDVQLGQVLADRLANFVTKRHFLGVSSPWNGLVGGAAATGDEFAADTPTYGELLKLYHGVKPAYRSSRSTAFVLNDATLMNLRLLTDDAGQPVWQTDLRSDAPDRLLGKPIVYAPDLADGTVIYGDLSRFMIREVQDIVIRRLNERFIDSLAVGFVGYYRGGCGVVDVSGGAIVKQSVASA